MKRSLVVKIVGGVLFAAALGAIALAQGYVIQQVAAGPTSGPNRRPLPAGTLVELSARLDAPNRDVPEATPGAPGANDLSAGLTPEPTATDLSQPNTTPGPYVLFLPDVFLQRPVPTPISTKPEPPAVTPAAGWPDGLASQTGSKLGLHVVQNNDPYIMEFVRRVRPRVMKSVDDLGWLTDVKAASPNTVTIGRISGQNENWPDDSGMTPEDAAQKFIQGNMYQYTHNPGVDYWEGWNEYVPVTQAHWEWYAQFEAARACDMQAAGLHAAVGGFAAGTPEYDEMPYFLPALEAAHRCGAIFTLHEGVSPVPGCGIFVNKPAIIPGAPEFPGVTMGYMMLRYRFWYEGYLKPMGLGDLPLVISELAVGGIVPGSPCNGPGGSGWKGYSAFWVGTGVGPTGAQAWANLLAWYDSEIQQDPYVYGTTIFTAGAVSPWQGSDLHDVIIPLANYETALP